MYKYTNSNVEMVNERIYLQKNKFGSYVVAAQ